MKIIKRAVENAEQWNDRAEVIKILQAAEPGTRLEQTWDDVGKRLLVGVLLLRDEKLFSFHTEISAEVLAQAAWGILEELMQHNHRRADKFLRSPEPVGQK